MVRAYSVQLIMDGRYHAYGLRRQYRSKQITRERRCTYCGQPVKGLGISGGQFFKKGDSGTGYTSFTAHVSCFEKALPEEVARATHEEPVTGKETGSVPMAGKRTILYFAIDPGLRNRFKAIAALRGKSVKDWALEALEEKAERDLAAEKEAAAKGDLAQALKLIDTLSPVIAAGTRGKLDVVSEIRAMRDERLDAISGRTRDH